MSEVTSLSPTPVGDSTDGMIAGEPAASEAAMAAAALDDRDAEPRTPMRRLGSTRKLAAFNSIRSQVSEQCRVLEARAEALGEAARELAEHCKRRADLEHEYSRALDKLSRSRRPPPAPAPPPLGAHYCLAAAHDHTRSLARDHAALARLHGSVLAPRLIRAADDALRLHRKCREVLTERHDELAGTLADAAAAHKAHAAAAADWRAAATKLRRALDSRARYESADPPKHKKIKAIDKEIEKRRARHLSARATSRRLRAEYALSVEAANAALHRYYLDDLADIMMCMEVGFENVVGRCVRASAAGEERRARTLVSGAAALRAAADALDSHGDRQRWVRAHSAAFATPTPVPYVGPQPREQDDELAEEVGEEDAAEDESSLAVQRELEARTLALESAARALRTECAEAAKTLDAAETELLKQMEGDDATWDVNAIFNDRSGNATAPLTPAADDSNEIRRDQEDYYLAKFRAYVSCAGRVARLDAKSLGARSRLLPPGAAGPPPRAVSPPRRPLGRAQFTLGAGEQLPTVLVSCVRVISCYGLRHQGLFRVSGSQSELSALRTAFERGEDPLAHKTGPHDINTVCALLKLWVREVRPALIPARLREPLLSLCSGGDVTPVQWAANARAQLAALPTAALLALRYLFAFLNHLAEQSAHTMMDAWNLAICLGPSLVAAAAPIDQVHQQHMLNELVKRLIERHEEVFPQNIAPHLLYSPPPVTEAVDQDVTDHDASTDHEDIECTESDVPSVISEPSEHEDVKTCTVTTVVTQNAPTPPIEKSSDAPVVSVIGSPVPNASNASVRSVDATPDLVLDLPLRVGANDAASPPAGSADTFALNTDTLRRRTGPVPPVRTDSCVESVTLAVSSLAVSPASSRPAPPAKPTLLRRPTPHPHRPSTNTTTSQVQPSVVTHTEPSQC